MSTPSDASTALDALCVCGHPLNEHDLFRCHHRDWWQGVPECRCAGFVEAEYGK